MADEIKNNVEETQVENTQDETTDEELKTYTQEEVDRMIQSESDKRVTQALKTQREKINKEKSLSALDQETREKVETNERIAELEEQLKDMNAIQAKQEVMQVLSARGINPEFASLIAIGEDAQEAIEKIDVLEKAFKKAVQEEVKKRLSQNGGSVKDTGIDSGEITKEQFVQMTLAQQSEIFNTDPELFKRLSR